MQLQEISLERYKIDKGVTSPSPVVFSSVDPVKFIPTFDELQVTEFFNWFEKYAAGNKWPKENWSSLVQNALNGIALRSYDCLSFGEVQDYEALKHAVLRFYEMRSEVFGSASEILKSAWMRLT